MISVVTTTGAALATVTVPPADLSVAGMFAQADWVVKSVMLLLVLASVATLSVALRKAWEITAQRKSIGAALAALERGGDLDSVARIDDAVVAAMVGVAIGERDAHAADKRSATGEGAKERAVARIGSIEAGQQRRLSRGLSVLGSIGAAAPFVGLFGTVWGIMNSFIGIARTQTTSLAVVAPGIAEALLATTFGLVAAIPAVLAYNAIARAIGGYRLRMHRAATQVLCQLSRELETATPRGTGAGVHTHGV